MCWIDWSHIASGNPTQGIGFSSGPRARADSKLGSQDRNHSHRLTPWLILHFISLFSRPLYKPLSKTIFWEQCLHDIPASFKSLPWFPVVQVTGHCLNSNMWVSFSTPILHSLVCSFCLVSCLLYNDSRMCVQDDPASYISLPFNLCPSNFYLWLET